MQEKCVQLCIYIVRLLGNFTWNVVYGYLRPDLLYLLQTTLLAEHLNGLIKDTNDTTGMGPEACIVLQTNRVS